VIAARALFCAYLGRRWKPFCPRCRVDLPGRYADKKDALKACAAHVLQRHTAAKDAA
jgi:hypothetical protein